jgi:type VI secretion system protein ImpH
VTAAATTAPAAPPDGAADTEWLERGRRAGFHALIALLERLTPSAVRVGEAGPAEREAIRFHHTPSLAFSSADVENIRINEAPELDEGNRPGRRFDVTTTFLGLSGPVSPLPDHFCDELAFEDEDAPMRSRFFDIFHHRLLSLLYRGVSKFNHAGEYELGGADRWSRRILALLGVDAFMSEAPAPASDRRLRLAALLVGRGRGPHALCAALEDDLAEELEEPGRVAIHEFIGSWIDLEDEDKPRLGRSSMQLGRSAILGGRIFDRAARFRVGLGPVSYDIMRRLLPGGDLHGRVGDVVRLVGSRLVDCELEVTVGAGEAPGLRLTTTTRQGLGRDTWLGRRAGDQKKVVVPLG